MTAPGGAQPADRPVAGAPAADQPADSNAVDNTVDNAVDRPAPAAPVPATTADLRRTARPSYLPPPRAAAPKRTVRTSAATNAIGQRQGVAALRAIGQRLGQKWAGQQRTRHRPQGSGQRSPAGATIQRTQLANRAREVVRTIGIGRVLCWQLAVLALLASIGEPRTAASITAVAALAVIAATAIRFRGRWLYEWLLRAIRFLGRRRHQHMEAGAGTADNLVDLVTTHTRVETVDVDDVPVAFIHHPAGITAVLEPHEPGGQYADGFNLAEFSLSSPAPLLPPPDVDSPPFAAQMIMQMAQAPAGTGHRGASRRRTWITIQAIRTPDLYQEADLNAALANAVRRLIRRLARDELPTRTLDREEAMSLILGLSQLGDAVDSPEPVPVRETWGAWEAGSRTQACFRIHNWQDVEENARQLILRRLQMVPSLGTTVAVAARRPDRRSEARSHVVIRISEIDRARLNNSADLLAFAMENTGTKVRLERLNGDHLAAVAASLPFGGQSTLH